MKTAVIYSSKTGNTRRVAEAIFAALNGPKQLLDVKEAPDNPSSFDWLILGFWVNRGLPAQEMLDFMEQIRAKTVSLFMTLGAYPDSAHAGKVIDEVSAVVTVHNRVEGRFICQGKIDPALTERLYQLPKNHPHYMDADRIARHKEAARHPNEADFARARSYFRHIQNKLSCCE